MSLVTRRLGYAALLLGAASMLSGCDVLKTAAGKDKEPPDEFAVVSKAPLIIPPDYNLRPPRPGAAATNELEPSETAQQSLYGTDAASVAKSMPNDRSEGEKLLLANAGAQNADPSIRQDIATDHHKDEEAASDDFTNTVLFWNKPSESDEGLNADAALKAGATGPMPAAQPGGTAPTSDTSKDALASSSDTGNAAQTNSESSATIQKSDSEKKKDSGSWFDWF